MKHIIHLFLSTLIFSSFAIAQDYGADLKNIRDTLNAQDQQVRSRASRNQASDKKALLEQIKKRINVVRETSQKIQAKASDCQRNTDPRIKKDCEVSIKNKIAEMKSDLAGIDADIKKLK